MALMQISKSIPPAFLKTIAANTQLYKDCPIEIKRQIWQLDETLFRYVHHTTKPLLHYINTSDTQGPSVSTAEPVHGHAWQWPCKPTKRTLDASFSSPTKTVLTHAHNSELAINQPLNRRESNPILQELVRLVGKSLPLYNLMLHFFRTLFANTNNTHFCSLRADLLMALHDSGVSEVRWSRSHMTIMPWLWVTSLQIYESDPCHNFAWCLDACIKDNNVEIRRIREMQAYFDLIPSGNSTTPHHTTTHYTTHYTSSQCSTHSPHTVISHGTLPIASSLIFLLCFLGYISLWWCRGRHIGRYCDDSAWRLFCEYTS